MRTELPLFTILFGDDVWPCARHHLEVVVADVGGADRPIFNRCAGRMSMLLPKVQQILPILSSWLLTETMYLLSATGASKFAVIASELGSCRLLSVRSFHLATTSSAVTGVPSEKRAFGSIRNRYVSLSGEICQCVASAGDVVERRRMQPEEGFVHHRVDHLVPRSDVRAVISQRAGKVGHVAVFQLAPFDRFRIADEVEVGVRFPPLALESLSALARPEPTHRRRHPR